MSNWTWPAVALIGIVVAGVVALFALATDQPTAALAEARDTRA